MIALARKRAQREGWKNVELPRGILLAVRLTSAQSCSGRDLVRDTGLSS